MFLTIETKSNCRLESNIPSQKRREKGEEIPFFQMFVLWVGIAIYTFDDRWNWERKIYKSFFFFLNVVGNLPEGFSPHSLPITAIDRRYFFSFWFQIFDPILWSESKVLSIFSSSFLRRFPKTDMKKCAQQILMLPHTSPVVSPPHFYNITPTTYSLDFQTHIHG